MATDQHIKHPEGLELVSPRGEQRGFVEPMRILEDLWVMQGSLCDLRCKHCYTNSSPSNDRLQQISFAELRPHLEEASRFGVRKIYFTGGEVFVNEDVLSGRAERNEELLKSVAYALEIAPVEILTNGGRHICNHLEALGRLRGRLTFRVTLESPEAAHHDALRGRGAFLRTTETIRMLNDLGFPVTIAAERPMLGTRSDDEIREGYLSLFPGANVEISLIENMLEMGRLETPKPGVFVTTECFAVLGKRPEELMCHFSRCIQKIDGQLRYYPCPVIYDDPRYELGSSLAESLRRVYIAHKNCYDYCLKGRGATCRTQAL